jgi:putative transposase
MAYWERRLPHWIPEHTPIFVTWRLAGTLPLAKRESTWMEADAELDRIQSGPRWLIQPPIAEITANALCYGDKAGKYRLHSWVVMPNHVHAVITPESEFSDIMRWLKWTTARRSNQLLGRRGTAFWQDESYDHWIRSGKEFESIVAYVEWNPVAAGLVARTEQWEWSSASRQAPRSPAPQD